MKSVFELIRVFFFGKKDEEAELDFTIHFTIYDVVFILVLLLLLCYKFFF